MCLSISYFQALEEKKALFCVICRKSGVEQIVARNKTLMNVGKLCARTAVFLAHEAEQSFARSKRRSSL
jgi:hypothetical protein